MGNWLGLGWSFLQVTLQIIMGKFNLIKENANRETYGLLSDVFYFTL